LKLFFMRCLNSISFVYFLQENADQEACCWRNLFSCINLVRILQKLTKWKHSRTMVNMLVFLALFGELEASVFLSSFRLSNTMERCFLGITASFSTGCLPAEVSLQESVQCLEDVCFANKKNCLLDACCV